MTAFYNIVYYVGHKLAVSLIAFVLAYLLDILLYGPDSPHGYVRLLYLVDLHGEGLF